MSASVMVVAPFWMDNMRCQGAEAYLVQYRHNSFKNHNCGHYEDAEVICEGAVVTSCDACNKWASCAPILKAGQAVSSQHSSNCSCIKGFSGDGMSCYNTTTCSAARASCCPAGYRWSP
ncbi:hypothetical protein MHYP_G00295190 [Metynnis hypsauchen]